MPGVFVSSGMDLEIGNISFNINTGEVAPITVRVRLDTWDHWLSIAKEMRDIAESAAKDVLAAHAADDNTALGAALEREFRYGMLSISASAIAIDAFYAGVSERHGRHPQHQEWQVNGLARHKQVAETLRWAWNLKADTTKTIRDRLKLVYKLRGMAVHPPADFREPILRPDIDRHVEWRFSHFRAENARGAFETVSNIIEAFLRTYSQAPRSLQAWVVASRPRFAVAAGYDVREAEPPPEVDPSPRSA